MGVVSRNGSYIMESSQKIRSRKGGSKDNKKGAVERLQTLHKKLDTSNSERKDPGANIQFFHPKGYTPKGYVEVRGSGSHEKPTWLQIIHKI
jgi:hypothetical protein